MNSTTQMWHKWLYTDAYNVYHRHRGNCCAVFQGMVLVRRPFQRQNLQIGQGKLYGSMGKKYAACARAPHLVTDLQRQYS
jgi:hypothetical protein